MKRMLARLLRVSPAMVVAVIALFVALTGTAVATTSVLITGKQIKNGSITGLDIKNKSVTARDIKGQLRGVRGLSGTPGAKGDKGDRGDKGDAGAKGDPGITGYQIINVSSAADSNSSKNAQAFCPAGMKVIGGGAVVFPSSAPVAITTSVVNGIGSDWFASAQETTAFGGAWAVHARAICANVLP